MTDPVVRLRPDVPVRIASRNIEKARELIVLWGAEPPPLISAGGEYREVPETADTYEGNAVLKARALSESVGSPALADDSGIEVEAMGWGPGVLSARTPSLHATWEERNAHILRAVAGSVSRRARFVCVCALVVPGFEPVLGRGEVKGTIADGPRGNNGFGYDPIFLYGPYGGRTFGEVPAEMKNEVSHRGRAVRALRIGLAAISASR